VKSDLQALRRQSQILLEKAASNTQLNEALGQIEELQRELGREKEERTFKEGELQEELHQLRDSNLAEENKKLEEKLSVLSSEVNAWETKATAANQEVEDLKAKISSLEAGANQEGGSCSFHCQ